MNANVVLELGLVVWFLESRSVIRALIISRRHIFHSVTIIFKIYARILTTYVLLLLNVTQHARNEKVPDGHSLAQFSEAYEFITGSFYQPSLFSSRHYIVFFANLMVLPSYHTLCCSRLRLAGLLRPKELCQSHKQFSRRNLEAQTRQNRSQKIFCQVISCCVYEGTYSQCIVLNLKQSLAQSLLGIWIIVSEKFRISAPASQKSTRLEG